MGSLGGLPWWAVGEGEEKGSDSSESVCGELDVRCEGALAKESRSW